MNPADGWRAFRVRVKAFVAKYGITFVYIAIMFVVTWVMITIDIYK